jgi:hypothetical protein
MIIWRSDDRFLIQILSVERRPSGYWIKLRRAGTFVNLTPHGERLFFSPRRVWQRLTPEALLLESSPGLLAYRHMAHVRVG